MKRPVPTEISIPTVELDHLRAINADMLAALREIQVAALRNHGSAGLTEEQRVRIGNTARAAIAMAKGEKRGRKGGEKGEENGPTQEREI